MASQSSDFLAVAAGNHAVAEIRLNPLKKSEKTAPLVIRKILVKSGNQLAGNVLQRLGVLRTFFGQAENPRASVGLVRKRDNKPRALKFAHKDSRRGFVAVDASGKPAHRHPAVLAELKKDIPMRRGKIGQSALFEPQNQKIRGH